jgi:hypothetical protein
MEIRLTVSEDFIIVGDNGKLIRRPVNMSRARWLALWKHVAACRFTATTLKWFLPKKKA